MRPPLALGFVGLLLTLALPAAPPAPPALRLVLAGDSTVTDGGGWAPGFRFAWQPAVEVINTARSGASSVSFRSIGAWQKALDAQGHYLLIQFGHNDVPGKGPGRETDAATTFRANLARFVDEARAAGAQPILVTSIAHFNFAANGRLRPDPLAPYVAATRDVAAEKRVPCLDLNRLTTEFAETLGAARSANELGRMLPNKDGQLKVDTTHLGFSGGAQVGRMAAAELVRLVPALQSSLRPAEPPPSASGRTKWERRANEKQALTKGATWFNHEPLAFLLRRGGGNSDTIVEDYERQHEPEQIRRLAAAGVSHAGLIHFYKGLGLKAEGPDIDKTRRTVEVAHSYGMKVTASIAGTMFTETFYAEVPEARGWEQRDAFNLPVPYTQLQSFRHYACPHEPAYRDYLRRVLKIAVQEVKADQIMFDNVMLQPEPRSCHCARCATAFRDFLRLRYPDAAAAFRRFGLADTGAIQLPEWNDPAAPDTVKTIDDPVLQEWVRFRCESLAGHANELYDYVKKLNPRVAVGFNIKGLYSSNRLWTNAVYHPLFASRCDMLTLDTSGYDSRIDPTGGALVSQIRSYKMAQRLGMNVDEVVSDELHAAVHTVFNRPKGLTGVGYVGGPFAFGAHNVFTPALEFFREHYDRYFTNVQTSADVAVLRTWASTAYSVSANYVPLTLTEQVLIQHHVPFDLLHEEEIDRIDAYPGVILAGQDCVSDAQLAKLLHYVRAGGTVFATEDTGRYNERREVRRTHPLFPARTEGRGRIVLLPNPAASDSTALIAGGDGDLEITGGVEPRVRRFAPQQWVLPRNHAAIADAIARGLPRPLTLIAEAPLTTVVEVVTRPETAETIVHALNFDRKQATAPFALSIRKAAPGAVTSVTVLSLDADEPQPLPFRDAADTVTFTMPANRLHTMAVIAQTRPTTPPAPSGQTP
jgi:lysophospholipase L1-like esterase